MRLHPTFSSFVQTSQIKIQNANLYYKCSWTVAILDVAELLVSPASTLITCSLSCDIDVWGILIGAFLGFAITVNNVCLAQNVRSIPFCDANRLKFLQSMINLNLKILIIFYFIPRLNQIFLANFFVFCKICFYANKIYFYPVF